MTDNANNNPRPYDPISDTFNVESEIVSETRSLQPVDLLTNEHEQEVRRFRENVDADFAYAHENIQATIEKAARALDKAIDLASASQSARAYEVVFNGVKVLTDANHSLLDLSKKSKELKALELLIPDEGPTNVTNNLFVGSMEELQKVLKNVGVETTSRQVPPKTIENNDDSE